MLSCRKIINGFYLIDVNLLEKVCCYKKKLSLLTFKCILQHFKCLFIQLVFSKRVTLFYVFLLILPINGCTSHYSPKTAHLQQQRDAAFSNNAQRSDAQQDVIYYQRRFYHHHNDIYIKLGWQRCNQRYGTAEKKRMWFQTKTSMEKVHSLDISSNSSTILCNALDRSINKRSVLATTQFRKSKDAKA